MNDLRCSRAVELPIWALDNAGHVGHHSPVLLLARNSSHHDRISAAATNA